MLTTPAKFSSGQRWPPARRVTVPSPLGAQAPGKVWGVLCVGWRGVVDCGGG